MFVMFVVRFKFGFIIFFYSCSVIDFYVLGVILDDSFRKSSSFFI